MATPVTLPELGESVTEGTVTRWLKQVGDSVELDEPLLEISTDKVDTEIPSPVAGTLLQIKADEDETVEVGAELAVIGDESEAEGGTEGGTQGGDSGGQPEREPEQPEPEPEAASAQAESEPEPEPEAESSAASSESAQGSNQGGGGATGGTPVTLPELGESVTEGTVTRWLKQVGDSVELDEPLLEISTDKVDTEIPSPVAGTLLQIKADEDETVEVGAELAVIGDESEAEGGTEGGTQGGDSGGQPEREPEQPEPEPEAASAQAESEPEPEAASAQAESEPEPEPAQRAAAPEPARKSAAPEPESPATSSDSGAYVTPIVRKLATQHGVALEKVEGSGVGGRIRKQDVLEAAKKQESAAPAAAPAAPAATDAPSESAGLRGTVQKANRIRQLTAIKTKESLQISAQLTQVHEVDVTKIARLREQAKAAFLEREGVKLTYLPFFAKATVEALKQHPNVNASYDEETKEVTYHSAINLGIAVDTEKGLLSVVIHDAGDLSLSGLAQRIADLAARARSNQIKPDELTGGTFTVTNIGSNGALFDTPIIVQPQSGMLGTGAVVKRPVVIADAEGSDTIAVRSMAFLPLTYDHRLIDGADAGRFVTTIKKRLEEGSFESDLG